MVLGILGIVLSVIWVAAESVYRMLKNSNETREILSIAQNAHMLLTPQQDIGAGFLTQAFVASGVIPKDMIVYPGDSTGQTVLSPWGTQVQIASQSNWGGLSDPKAYEIVYWNLTTAECANILGPLLGPNTASLGLTKLYVDCKGAFDPATSNLSAVGNCTCLPNPTVNLVMQFKP